MNHDRAYADLLAHLMPALSEIETEESAQRFVSAAADRVRHQATEVREFYIGEFLNIFKDAVVRQSRADARECQQAITDAKTEADILTVQLQARLATASAAGDREAEHEIWRDREEQQAACQKKIDAESRRIGSISLRIAMCESLASALGHAFT